jgi:hypothetical protein
LISVVAVCFEQLACAFDFVSLAIDLAGWTVKYEDTREANVQEANAVATARCKLEQDKVMGAGEAP